MSLVHAKLSEKFGAKAESWIQLAETIFEKWISRDCWREVKNGGVWIVPDFGTDLKTGKWSSGYDSRKTTGFTNPDNKLNHIARWMLAMYDVTKKTVYRDHECAEEIVQAVFIILAKKAAGLFKHTQLEGWLYETARLASIRYLRDEIRRQRHQKEALSMRNFGCERRVKRRKIGRASCRERV